VTFPAWEDRFFEAAMLRDLKLTVCSAAVASASFSQAGAFGYGALVAFVAALLSALGRSIWRSLVQAGHDRGIFMLRDKRAARRRSEGTFNPLLLPAAINKASINRENRHVQT
jgi:hypothetical protein